MTSLLIADPLHHSSSRIADSTTTLLRWVGVERRIDGDHRRGRPIITYGLDDVDRTDFIEKAVARRRKALPWE